MNKDNKKMQNMMSNMCANMSMDECRKMMAKMTQGNSDFQNMKLNNDEDFFGTLELKVLFNEWCQQIEDEIKSFIKENNSSDIDKIAEHLKLSEESCKILLEKINQKN